jgi:hypothetical protein
VTADECLRVSGDPTEFQRMIGQLDVAEDGSGKSATGKTAPARGPASGSPVRR